MLILGSQSMEYSESTTPTFSNEPADVSLKRKRINIDVDEDEARTSPTKKDQVMIARSPIINRDMLSPFLLGNVNICNKITSCLDPVSFVRLTRVSKRLRISLRNVRWNLSRKLERFVDDPEDFRSALRQSCALIGGDFARQFFRGLISPNETLDIYVERGTQADWFCDYLEDKWAYKQVWASSNLDVSETCIHKHRGYLRKTARYGSVFLRVQETEHLPLAGLLSRCYFTGNANVITWDKAYSIFPYATFVQRKLYALRPSDHMFAGYLNVYRREGWKLEDVIRPLPKMRASMRFYGPRLPSCMRNDRQLGDADCWTINLCDTFGPNLSRASPVGPNIELNMFRVSSSELGMRGYRSPCFPLRLEIFEHQMLKFGYLFQRTDWKQALRNRLDDMLLLELACMDDKDRPDTFIEYSVKETPDHLFIKEFIRDSNCDPAVDSIGGIPIGRDYADDMLQEWFNDFYRQRPEYTHDSDHASFGCVYLH